MRLLVSSGEASGELYGAKLIEALRCRVPGLEAYGVGGEQMRAAGCDTVVDARELAVVGMVEILSHLPQVYRAFRRLVREMDRRRPDAAVVIDSPAFNFKVAAQLHRRGVPVVYYVSPQLWAWRESRIRFIRRYVRKVLVIFPFEEAWYRERGVDAEYVGHPLVDLPPPAISRQEFAARYHVDPEKHWIALLPGSRRKEVSMNLPRLLEAAERLGTQHEYLLPVASTLERRWLELMVRIGEAKVTLVDEARPALRHSRAAAVASGTATVEAALMGTPFVAVYRVSRTTYALGRPLVRVPHFAMVNLIAGREVVPELIQRGFTGEAVARGVEELLHEGHARERMLAGLAEVRARLQAGSSAPAAERAADGVLRAVGKA